jgi:transposase
MSETRDIFGGRIFQFEPALTLQAVRRAAHLTRQTELMDKAYEGNETRQWVLDRGMIPVAPPKSNRLDPWEYDRELYKKRNQVERLFRRLKGFRRIFSRFEKLDVVFLAFINFVRYWKLGKESEMRKGEKR